MPRLKTPRDGDIPPLAKAELDRIFKKGAIAASLEQEPVVKVTPDAKGKAERLNAKRKAKAVKPLPIHAGEAVLILLPSAPDFTSFPNVLFATREAWLTAAGQRLQEVIEDRCGVTLDPWRVSVGFPIGSRKAIGECFHASASSTGHREVFISPSLELLFDPFGVVATLAHELVHAAMPPEVKHKRPFEKAVRKLDLEGKPISTFGGSAFFAWAKPLIAELGDYPHSRLDRYMLVKKQTTRLLKLECPECGMILRTTAKWIEDIGPPLCAVDEVAFVEG